MQTKLKFSLPILLIAAMPALRVFAQEGNSPDVQDLGNHPELNLNDDKTLIMDADAKPPKIQSVAKEATQPATTQVNNAKKPDTQNKQQVTPDKTEEDLLQFNFLYFIIQKFKISDIIDDD